MTRDSSDNSVSIQQLAQVNFERLEFSQRPAGVPCPACRQQLSIATVDGLKVAACEQCLGILIECEMLAGFVQDRRSSYRGPDTPPKPLDPSELNVSRECPSCGGYFDTHPYYGPGNAVIDSCMGCRLIWLDQGELDSIIRAPGQR